MSANSPAKVRGNAAWEQRFRERGGAHFSLRVSANAAKALERLGRRHNCTRKDVIEGLLLGTIKPDPILGFAVVEGLSDAEAALL